MVMTLNFDNGIRTIYVEGDKSRPIRWNPQDVNNIDKILKLKEYTETEFLDKIAQLDGKIVINEDGAFDIDKYEIGGLSNISDEALEKLCEAFGKEAANSAFQGVSPLSRSNDPEHDYLYTEFVAKMIALVEEDVKPKTNKDYVNRHLKNKKRAQRNHNRNHNNQNKKRK